MSPISRRELLRFSSLGACAAVLPVGVSPPPAAAPKTPKAKFRLGIGTYTFRAVDVDALVVRCRELGLRHIELSHPQFMLPQVKLEAIPALKEKLQAGGVEMLSYYCGHLKSAADLEKLLAVVERMEVKQVSGSAERERLPDLDRACSSAGFRFGTHNHYFQGRKFLYESPDDLLSAVAGRSPNLFITLDTGHMIACGFDPTEAYLKLKQHVRIIHLKDEDTPGHNVVLGKGKGGLGKFLRTIAREGFDGLAAIEYEEGTDPRQEVAECVGFVRQQVRLS